VSESISIVVVLSGLVSGGILGSTLATNTEKERRYRASKSLFLNNSALGVMLNSILWLLLLSAIFTLVGMGILIAGDAYPLSQADRYVLAASWILGMFVAKWLRYLYWVSNA